MSEPEQELLSGMSDGLSEAQLVEQEIHELIEAEDWDSVEEWMDALQVLDQKRWEELVQHIAANVQTE